MHRSWIVAARPSPLAGRHLWLRGPNPHRIAKQHSIAKQLRVMKVHRMTLIQRISIVLYRLGCTGLAALAAGMFGLSQAPSANGQTVVRGMRIVPLQAAQVAEPSRCGSSGISAGWRKPSDRQSPNGDGSGWSPRFAIPAAAATGDSAAGHPAPADDTRGVGGLVRKLGGVGAKRTSATVRGKILNRFEDFVVIGFDAETGAGRQAGWATNAAVIVRLDAGDGDTNSASDKTAPQSGQEEKEAGAEDSESSSSENSSSENSSSESSSSENSSSENSGDSEPEANAAATLEAADTAEPQAAESPAGRVATCRNQCNCSRPGGRSRAGC